MSNKTAKGAVSLITIIIVLSSILAGTVYYQSNKSNITANAIKNRVSGEAVGMEGVSGSVASKSSYLAHLSREQKALFDDAYKKHSRIPTGTLEGLCYVETTCREGVKHSPSETSVGPLGITNGVNNDHSENGKYDRRTLGGSIEIAARYTEELMRHPNYIAAASAPPEVKANMLQVAYNRGYSNMPTSAQIEEVLESHGYEKAGIVYIGATGVNKEGQIYRFNYFNKVLGTEEAASSQYGTIQTVAYIPDLLSTTEQEMNAMGWHAVPNNYDQSITFFYSPQGTGDVKHYFTVKDNGQGYEIIDSSRKEYIGKKVSDLRGDDGRLIVFELTGGVTVGLPGQTRGQQKGQPPPSKLIPPSEPYDLETDTTTVRAYKITDERQLFSTEDGSSCKTKSDDCVSGKLGQIVYCKNNECHFLESREDKQSSSKISPSPKGGQAAKQNIKEFASGGKLVRITEEGEYTTISIGSRPPIHLPKELADKIDLNAKSGFKDFNDIPTKSGGRMSVIEAFNEDNTIATYKSEEKIGDKSGTVKTITTTINKLTGNAPTTIFEPNQIKKEVKEEVRSGQKTKTTTTRTFENKDTEKIVSEGNQIKSVIWTSEKYKGRSISIKPEAYESIKGLVEEDSSAPDLVYRLRQMAFYSGIKNIDEHKVEGQNLIIKQGDKRVIVKKGEGSIYAVRGTDNLVASSSLAKDGMFYTFTNTKWNEKTSLPILSPGAEYVGQDADGNLKVAAKITTTGRLGFRYSGDKESGYTSVEIVSGFGLDSVNLNAFSGGTSLGTLSLIPVNDPNSKVNGMYSVNNGQAYLKTSSGPFGVIPAGWYDVDGNKLNLEPLDPSIAEKALNAKADFVKESTPQQLSSQRFFADVERVFTEYRGLGYYSTLFFDEDSLLQWRDNVDRIFATAYLGTEYWSSAICGSYLDGEGEGIAYAETPQGLAQVGAHIEATRTSPIIDESGTATFIYKITFAIRNGDYEKDPRAPEEMNFNVVLKGGRIVKAVARSEKEKGTMREINATDKKVIPASFKISNNKILADYVLTDYVDYTSADYKTSDSIAIKKTGGKTVKVFKQDQNVTRGSSFSKIGRNAIVQDSEFLYDEVCIIFDKTPSRWKIDDNELCNKIIESSGEATALASLQAGAGGGRSDEINDF